MRFLIFTFLTISTSASFAAKFLSQKVNISVTSSVVPVGAQDFTTRCAGAGVVRCVGFDTSSDIAGVLGDPHGVLGVSAGSQNEPVLDKNMSASGTSSLKFTVTSVVANSGGSYWLNFSDNYSLQFDSGQEFYVQWRQRFSPEYLAMNLSSYGSGGWKQIIVGGGDQPGCDAGHFISTDNGGHCVSSCSDLETNVQNTNFRKFPQMYNSCSGSSSTQNGRYPGGTPPYNGFEEPFGAYDFKLQNAMSAPYCLYSQANANTQFSPAGNCFGYFANEWMTFQMHIVIGQRTADYFKNSHIDLWVARQGQASVQIFNWGPYDLAAGPASQMLKYGKVWLMSYDTNKTSDMTTIPTAYTWYDELIVSKNRIADPK